MASREKGEGEEEKDVKLWEFLRKRGLIVTISIIRIIINIIFNTIILIIFIIIIITIKTVNYIIIVITIVSIILSI